MSTKLLERPAPAAPPRPSPLRRRAERDGGQPSFARRLLRGRPEDPRWVRPGLIGLLLATAVLYLWGLGASGWANSFYSAAVQAGSAQGVGECADGAVARGPLDPQRDGGPVFAPKAVAVDPAVA